MAMGRQYGFYTAGSATSFRADTMIDRIAENAAMQGNTRAALARSSRYQRMVNRAVQNMLSNSNG